MTENLRLRIRIWEALKIKYGSLKLKVMFGPRKMVVKEKKKEKWNKRNIKLFPYLVIRGKVKGK